MSHKHPQDETQPPAPKDETIEMIAVEPTAAQLVSPDPQHRVIVTSGKQLTIPR